MDDNLAAVGRNVGKVDTDADGLARYSLKLLAPPGINHDTEPELSLEYCQGTANGSLGVGWALGGVSAIRVAPSRLAYDDFNKPPSNYDRFQPKLLLDGAELLKVSENHEASGASYATETDGIGRTITPLQSGFLVRYSNGHRAEYGTTADSCVMKSDQQEAREWRLKRYVDYYGNAVTYDYVTSPRKGHFAIADTNTCYLAAIRYTSNEKLGYKGKRIVKLEYSDRPDPVVQTVQGEKSTWASLLTAIRFGVVQDNDNEDNNERVRIDRSYEMEYGRSLATGDSYLAKVTETGGEGSGKLSLVPSLFGYTTPEIVTENLFRVPQQVFKLENTTHNVELFTMNISGRCLADIACVRYNPKSNQISIKTFLAIEGANRSIGWQPSNGPGGEAKLPSMKLEGKFPNILCPDLNNDGRSDLVVPYCDSDGRIRFSISQSLGTGFMDAITVATDFKWAEGSRFMASDLNGRGGTDIIQIFTDRQRLAFRNFPVVKRKEVISLGEAAISRTKYENAGTIDWCQLTHAGTGTNGLLRIWAQNVGQGQQQLKATAFALSRPGQPNTSFEEITTSMLGVPVRNSDLKYSVLPCDINADGVQDLVLATAEYHGNRMTLIFTIYLGDGYGGFKQHGDAILRQFDTPAPLHKKEHGQFHVTNLNGSNYPSLSYVYQTMISKAYKCLSVNGQSDGKIGRAMQYVIANDLPTTETKIFSADINGNGLGDWLLYTLENDRPRLVPAYNTASATDLLSWARDSMGLRTSLTYSCLSDRAVYTPAVNWEKYSNDSEEFYPVIAAPNYVVSKVEHSNDLSINSMKYNVQITKHYGKARINILGRGWQGFEQIVTTNSFDNVLTTERYLQDWPLTGTKCQIDTATLDEPILKSIKTFYDVQATSKGFWKTYRTNRVLEQVDIIDKGTVSRSHSTRYEYDEHGNMILMSPSEMQHGKLVHESWSRCSYTTIDGVVNVLTGEKISGEKGNADMKKFEPGDFSLTIYENQKDRATLKNMFQWSTDIGDFSKTQVMFDDFGKKIETVNAAGLRRATTYDNVFHTFPVKVVEQGSSLSLMELTAYDEASGIEVARQEQNGLLTCYRVDLFGRVFETRSKALGKGEDAVAASDFLAQKPFVADASLNGILAKVHLDPQRQISFERTKDSSGATCISAKIVVHSNKGASGQQELVEYLDCVKQVRKRSCRDGDDDKRIWQFWERDSRGNCLFESFPSKCDATITFDKVPADVDGTRSTYDALGRSTQRIRPAHRGQDHFIVSTTEYLDGGATVRERTITAEGSSASAVKSGQQLALLVRRYIRIGKEDLVVENVDENGFCSKFEYDAVGRLVCCTDAAGRQELRTYNANGNIVSLQNSDQNTTGDPTVPAFYYHYDIAHHLIATVNAAKEKITYQRDEKGRTLLKAGDDGRILKYVYDSGGFENLSSVAIYPNGSELPFESHFAFSYDHRGRLKDRKLTVKDVGDFVTSVLYNWQDHVIRRVTPDGAVLEHEYRGSEIISSNLSSGSDSSWSVKAETSSYSAFGQPQKVTIQGSGMEKAFVHEWRYNSQGFPISHILGTESETLVKEDYLYNDLDQIVRKHEFVTGVTAEYNYSGKRLVSSELGERGVNTYAYDAAGNLTKKQNTVISYAPGRATGLKEGISVFEMTYDKAGRLHRRITEKSSFTFTYNAFGALHSLKDLQGNTSVEYLTDFEDETLYRKRSDGSSDLLVDDDFSIHIENGSPTIYHKLLCTNNSPSSGQLLATVSNTYQTTKSTHPLSGSRIITSHFTDTKGNVTRTFDCKDASLHEALEYDDFGLLDFANANDPKFSATSTYEGKYTDKMSGLIDFGARWYDPLTGRFTTPDSILDIGSLLKTDGLNRYVFENNDPINHVDPTGHWSWSAVVGVVMSAVLIVAAVAITAATGGAATPLAAAVVGALIGGGVAGIQYSVNHRDEDDAGKFWGGFATTVALNAAIGAATGYLGAIATPARIASATARIALKAAIGGSTSILTKAADRGVENVFYGQHHDLFEDALKNFLVGAAAGAAIGAFGTGKGASVSGGNPQNKLPGINKFDGPFKLRNFTGLRQVLEPKPSNPWSELTKQMLKEGGKGALKPGIKLVSWGVQESGLDKQLVSGTQSWFKQNVM